MSKIARALIGILWIGCALFAACSRPPEPKKQQFTGRLLLLAGDNAEGKDLVDLTGAGSGNTYNTSTLAKGVREATPTQDRTHLLYATKDEIMLRDLQAASSKSVVKTEGYCLSWSPDGKRFSYKQRAAGSAATKLYVSDLDGKTKMIWEDSSGIEGAEARYCAQWIAPDRIVFDRFVGMIPKQAVSENLKPNTTTVAVVGDTTKFIDSPRKWTIEGICPSGNAILTAADQSQPIVIAKTLEPLDKLNPTPGPSEGRFIGFAASSCLPFFISQSTSTATDLFSLNPTSWQRLRTSSISYTFSPNARFLIKSSAKLMVVGDSPDKFLLIDTESGDFTPFFSTGSSPLKSPVPIVWIEN